MLIADYSALTDRQVFAKATVNAIRTSLMSGLTTAVVLGVWTVLPRIGTLLAVPVLVLNLLTIVWIFGSVVMGLGVVIGRRFGAWQDQPYDAKWFWAAHVVRSFEGFVFVGFTTLLYRFVWIS